MDLSKLYWETYDDQTENDGFTFVGVGEDVQPITNMSSQVKELQRKYGIRSDIRVYKEV